MLVARHPNANSPTPSKSAWEGCTWKKKHDEAHWKGPLEDMRLGSLVHYLQASSYMCYVATVTETVSRYRAPRADEPGSVRHCQSVQQTLDVEWRRVESSLKATFHYLSWASQPERTTKVVFPAGTREFDRRGPSKIPKPVPNSLCLWTDRPSRDFLQRSVHLIITHGRSKADGRQVLSTTCMVALE